MRRFEKSFAVFAFALLRLLLEPPLLKSECTSGTLCTCTPSIRIEAAVRRGRWFLVETENFQICCDESEDRAKNLARHAEGLRVMLQSKWFGTSAASSWNPRCQIVLHANQPSYVAAIGRGGERTVGASLVNVEQGKITARRIDLLGGRTEFLTAALPHELTHVVLRERFLSAPLPRWADEGTAILHDPPAKQARHRSDFRDAWAHRELIPTIELLTMEEYPGGDRMGTFYGQSAALAKFLVERETPSRFVKFIERAAASGYDAALRECYGISNVRELDRLWRRGQQSTLGAAIVGG